MLCAAAIVRAEVPAWARAWQPVTDAERNMKGPQVEKDAGVEALFWIVYVDDGLRGQDVERQLYHYVRLKIFDESGNQKLPLLICRLTKHPRSCG